MSSHRAYHRSSGNVPHWDHTTDTAPPHVAQARAIYIHGTPTYIPNTAGQTTPMHSRSLLRLRLRMRRIRNTPRWQRDHTPDWESNMKDIGGNRVGTAQKTFHRKGQSPRHSSAQHHDRSLGRCYSTHTPETSLYKSFEWPWQGQCCCKGRH